MQIIETTRLNTEQEEHICELWNKEYPVKLAHSGPDSFRAYLAGLEDHRHLLLLGGDGGILGWYFQFVREAERWFAMILDSSIHGKGYGTKLLSRAKENELRLNGWAIDHNSDRKSNGDIYRSPLEFYMKNGFLVEQGTRLELEKISAVKIIWIRE